MVKRRVPSYMLSLLFALAVFVSRTCDAQSADGATLVGSHSELKAAIANESIAIIDVTANLEFPSAEYELLIPAGRKVKIESTHHAVLTGGGITRFFTVAGDLTLSGLTLRNGRSDQGGAVSVTETGSLAVLYCTFSYNRAMTKEFATKPRWQKEDPVKFIWGEGGAIRFVGKVLTVEFSTFQSNDGIGGAIWSGDADSPSTASVLLATDTTFDGNKSPDGFGGAVVNHGKATLTRCLFKTNFAKTSAGAVYSGTPKAPVEESLLELHGSAFTDNTAEYGYMSNDVAIRGGNSAGDLSCGACEAVRTDGGLANGFCEALKCTGCPTNSDGTHESGWYQCAVGKGSNLLRQIAGKIQTAFW
jgi:hypothetical protein